MKKPEFACASIGNDDLDNSLRTYARSYTGWLDLGNFTVDFWQLTTFIYHDLVGEHDN